jgi:hypothetical protein
MPSGVAFATRSTPGRIGVAGCCATWEALGQASDDAVAAGDIDVVDLQVRRPAGENLVGDG